jgi:hypothetical protein
MLDFSHSLHCKRRKEHAEANQTLKPDNRVMERLRRTVVQLEEAKRFILDGEVARLRLALILLDNAVEVMLHRRVSEDVDRANMYARMLRRFPDGPLDAKSEALRQDIAAKIIPPARQKKVARYFGEKVTLLAESGQLPFATARALRHLHDYRNELQHHDHVRPESILPAALILFDIALDLTVTLLPGSTSWGSDDDLDWLQDYGIIEPFPIGRDDLRDVIAGRLRDGLPLDANGVREALIAHLGTRLDVMEGNLAELPTEGGGPQELADMLRHIRRWEQGLPDEPPTNVDISPFDKLGSFPRWRMETAGLSAIADRLELFDRFGTLEDQIEPLETALQDIVDAISAAGELAADIARGA